MKYLLKLLVGIILIAVNPSLTIAQKYMISSPDGRIEVQIKAQDELTFEQPIRYSVTVDQQPILIDSKIALASHWKDHSSEREFKIIDDKRLSVNRTVKPLIKQKSETIIEQYNQLSLMLSNHQTLSFRVFNDGVAYRFELLSDKKVMVKSERADFNFADDYLVYFPEEKNFISHNERAYIEKTLTEITDKQFASLPLLVDAENVKVVITETDLFDYPGLWLEGQGKRGLSATFPKRVLQSELKAGSDRNENILKRGDSIAEINQHSEEAITLPWRILAIARNDAELLTNQLSYLLARESRLKDTDWIKPGKVAWDWWNANNIYGVDFEAGINTATYKYYIDFAAKYGLEYIVLDEGWYRLGNVLDVVDEIDVKAIIDYGKSKNVDVILWVIWETLDQQLEKALDTYKEWGAAGIKVDFMQRDDQQMVNYYWKVARAAAQRQLLVNFHGSYKPAGLRRAFPNVITREGVRGLEHNKWADYITSEHNLTLPFIRMLAGPMDYTPGAMVNSQPENFSIVFNRPMSKTTRAHQVAMYIVFESPLQMLADSPSNYLKAHESTAFISMIPTVWDETKVLSAKLKEHIITARRSGKDWFIGMMSNSQGLDVEIDMSFLPDGQYRLSSFGDGKNAERYASDYVTKEFIVSNRDKVTISTAPNGGWAARLSVINE